MPCRQVFVWDIGMLSWNHCEHWHLWKCDYPFWITESTYSFASRFLRQKVPDSWPLKHGTCLYGDITIFLWRSCPVLWDTDHCPLQHHIFVIAGRKMLRDLKRNGDIAPSWSDTKNRFWGESDQLIKAKNVTPCRSKVSLKATCCSSF